MILRFVLVEKCTFMEAIVVRQEAPVRLEDTLPSPEEFFLGQVNYYIITKSTVKCTQVTLIYDEKRQDFPCPFPVI